MSRWLWLLLIGYVLTLYAFNLGSVRTFTGHECLVAQIAREMVATGDWLVPKIAGKPWLEKPPLPHWTVAALGELAGGIDEFVARLPSAVAGLVGVLLVTSLALRWFGSIRGLLTGLVLATSFYTVTYARLAEADIYLWALVLGCLWVFAREHVGNVAPSRWWKGRWLFYVLLGLTQLSKGPLFGALVALLPCAGLLVGKAFTNTDRSRGVGPRENPSLTVGASNSRLLRQLRTFGWFLHPGILVCLAISIAWPVAILLRYPETADLWWAHTFGRVGGAKVLNPQPFWYYFTTMPWQLLPWTLIMLPALPSSLRRAWRKPASADRFLWLWFLLPFVALSLISAKHHHYLIYALPPCAFWAADGLLRVKDWAAWWCADGRRIALTGLTAVASLLAVATLTNWLAASYVSDMLILGGLGSVALIALLGLLRVRRFRLACIGLFATLWLAYGYVHTSVLWKIDGYREETALLRRIDQVAQPGSPVFVLGLEPSRLLLYSPRPLEVYTRPQDMMLRGRERPDALVLTSVGHESQLRKFGQPTCVDRMAVARGEKLDPFRQFALYRVDWKGPMEVTSAVKKKRPQLP